MSATTLIDFHRKLLNDAGRMEAYRAAIMATVRPGDTVLDIGSGSGVLALFACQAGAAKVCCVERHPIIQAARELAEANGMSDRIDFFHGDIRDLKLEAPVDVIQSELIGKSLIGQNMAELVGLSRDRFLRPGGAILPRGASLFVAPADGSVADASARLPAPDAYRIEFAPLAERACNTPIALRIPATDLIAEGQVAYRYDAATAPPTDSFDTELSFTAREPRTLRGLVAWFVADLAPGISLGNPPPGTPSWDNHYFPLTAPVTLQPGDTIALRIAGRDDSAMTWLWRWETTVRRDGAIVAAFQQSNLHADMQPAVRKASAT